MGRCKAAFSTRRALSYTYRNQFATARGSNLTQVAILNEGMRPDRADLNSAMRDTANHYWAHFGL
jgi:hypothetical protein